MPFHPQGCKTLFRRSWTRHVKSVRKGKYKMTLEELLKAQGLSDEQIKAITAKKAQIMRWLMYLQSRLVSK